MNENGVGGCDVGDGHQGQIYQNDPNESDGASKRRISLSPCPWKSEIDPTRKVLDDPICEIDLNGGGGLRSDEVLKSCGSDCCWMTLYA